MPSFVYVLGCQTPGRCLTYVGWTTDVERRLAKHNSGTGARTTRGRVWVLLHTEKFRKALAALLLSLPGGERVGVRGCRPHRVRTP